MEERILNHTHYNNGKIEVVDIWRDQFFKEGI